MNPLIIIPTYVCATRVRNADSGDVLTTYDHMTPLNIKGELPRLLKSLEGVEGANCVAILVASEPSVREKAAKKVQDIASHFPNLNILVIGDEEQSLIHQRLEQLGAADVVDQISLSGYGAIRNMGLLVASSLGYDAVVFLDDDEVIDDPQFLARAVYGLGKLTRKGVPIIAKTGYYMNSEGNYHSKSQNKWYNHYWQQGKAFNAWIDSAMKGPRLSRSNHVCGGCLALHKEAFRRVAFDPWIPRGEDLDYMLSLRMYGADIWFDNTWHLNHFPPESTSEGVRFRQDIYRWLYEFRKMEYSRSQIDLLQIKPASLEPYPGPFLEPGIERRIKITAQLRSLGRPDKAAYRKAASTASNEAIIYAQNNCSKYFAFQRFWPEIMNRVSEDQVLQLALVQSAQWRRGAAPKPEPISVSTGIDADAVTRAAVAAGATISDIPAATPMDPGLTSEIRLNIAE